MGPRSISPEARKVGLAAFLSSTTFAVVLGVTAPAERPQRPETDEVKIQVLGVNDFHGRLEPPTTAVRRPGGQAVDVGGAAALDAHLDRAERSHPNRTIRVHAGDMVGASPLLSSHFHDEPTVRAMNLMDFDVGTLGNHEFDEGVHELSRLLRGGRRADGGQFKRDASGSRVNTSAPGFEGVDFPYIAANTVGPEGRLILPPTQVVERAGVKVGFIGVTTTATPDHVLDRHTKRFDWLDISDAVNHWASDLQRQGVEAIVVLAHSGGYQGDGDSRAAAGEIIDEAREMTGAVDVVVAGHTHSHLNTRVPNAGGVGDKLVVEANSYGSAFDRVRLRVDHSTGHVSSKGADTPTTWNDEVGPDAEVEALVARYRAALGPLGRRVVGRLELGIQREAVGGLAAHAQRRLANADIAFVDRGNARAGLPPGRVTYARIFEASAYEHDVLRMQMSGAGVRRVLEQQERGGLLHVAGLPAPLEDDAIYAVAANALLVDDEAFSAFRDYGREVRPVGTDLQALEGWLDAQPGPG